MKITSRDINIIETLKSGATISQIHMLYFPSYNVAAKRLKLLSKNKLIKETIHPILGKKVYYVNKIPSYHSLVITQISILLKNNIVYIQREYKINKYIVDCLTVLKDKTILVFEIDIFNRTSTNKLNVIIQELNQLNQLFKIVIVSKHKRRMATNDKIINITIDNINEVSNIINI